MCRTVVKRQNNNSTDSCLLFCRLTYFFCNLSQKTTAVIDTSLQGSEAVRTRRDDPNDAESQILYMGEYSVHILLC